MISFCIPIFNVDVKNLVQELLIQCKEFELNEFEILCIDDASTNLDLKQRNNFFLQNASHVYYLELSVNIGRAAIRNLLGEKAKYDFLIFIDSDSQIKNKFVSNYIKYKEEALVIYGGTETSKTAPSTEFLLRWKYSKSFEEKNIKERSKAEWLNFKTNNFGIHKRVLKKVKFDESLKKYGHEDTLFALQLKNNKIGILHIENEVIHLGMDRNDVFLRHTKQSLENLANLASEGKISEIKLLRFHNLLKRFRLDFILHIISKKYLKLIEFKLISDPRNINLFQAWKLLYYNSLFCKK